MQVLVGDRDRISNSPTTVFDTERLAFLAELSRRLLAHPEARTFADIVSYAYWSRRANLLRLAERHSDKDELRMGVGLSFHICPANVPINFAFSMAFGLLSGNTCVIRLPTKASPTIDIMVKVIADLITERPYDSLIGKLMIVRFDRDDKLNHFWMSIADARIVWGGDATVSHMRSFPCPPRSREVAFPDRYSIAAVNPKAVLALADEALQGLCQNLFNDLYLMDQAACSSPQLLVWLGEHTVAEDAKARLWPEIERLATSRYSPKPIQVMDKYVQACLHALNNEHVIKIERHKNQLYRVELSGVSDHQDEFRGYYGTIHEVTIETFKPLAPIINEKYQTLTYFGLDLTKVREFIVEHRLRGIDRVVPVGKALDMDIRWDGYEIIPSLSRSIVIN